MSWISELWKRPQLENQPALEPPGFNLLREMLMNRIFEQNANPYGFNPNWSGSMGNALFPAGGRKKFDSYGGMGAGMGGGGGMMPSPRGRTRRVSPRQVIGMDAGLPGRLKASDFYINPKTGRRALKPVWSTGQGILSDAELGASPTGGTYGRLGDPTGRFSPHMGREYSLLTSGAVTPEQFAAFKRQTPLTARSQDEALALQMFGPEGFAQWQQGINPTFGGSPGSQPGPVNLAPSEDMPAVNPNVPPTSAPPPYSQPGPVRLQYPQTQANTQQFRSTWNLPGEGQVASPNPPPPPPESTQPTRGQPRTVPGREPTRTRSPITTQPISPVTTPGMTTQPRTPVPEAVSAPRPTPTGPFPIAPGMIPEPVMPRQAGRVVGRDAEEVGYDAARPSGRPKMDLRRFLAMLQREMMRRQRQGEGRSGSYMTPDMRRAMAQLNESYWNPGGGRIGNDITGGRMGQVFGGFHRGQGQNPNDPYGRYHSPNVGNVSWLRGGGSSMEGFDPYGPSLHRDPGMERLYGEGRLSDDMREFLGSGRMSLEDMDRRFRGQYGGGGGGGMDLAQLF